MGPKGISLKGIEEMGDADEVFLEYYTTPHDPALISELERRSGRHLTVVDRAFVEDGKAILAEARSRKVVLAVPGDPMIATTHVELRVRALRSGIEARVVHAATVGSSAASASGLHFYKFSRTVTVTKESVKSLSQVYQILHQNLLLGAHTLLLLEFDLERGEGVAPGEAILGILNAEKNFKRGVVSEKTFALVLSRLGGSGEAYRAGEFAELEKIDYGDPPHSIVIPGSLHFTEVEAVESIFSLDRRRIGNNSDGIKRTAQTLVPRYIDKTRKALESIRARVGERYESVIENAELYMRDAESFLAKGDDELAMLSIGYAEGLLDSMNFAGVVKIDG